jgi:hypothetical protein
MAACLSLCAAQALAQDKWGAHIDFEAKPGSKRSLGEADLFIPLMQQERWLLFGNLRGRFDDDGGGEGNFGAGLRRMFEGGWNLGGYSYFDRRKTESGNYFNQGTFGAEALGRDWDFRANAYLPTGTKVKELDTADTASVSGTAVVVSSVTRDERALRGYDAEVGWRVPLFGADEPRQLRVYAGGYRFEDDTTKLSGPRLRAELTLAELSWLWRGAQFIGSAEAQDDDVRGSQAFLSLRLRVPLGGDPERRRTSAQERRMTAPVVRDVDIVAQVIARPAVLETATQFANGQAFTAIGASDFAGTDLTAKLTTAGPGSTVILSGTFNTSAASTMQPGQTVQAGTVMIRTPSGKVVPLTTSATINSTFSSGSVGAIAMANNSTVSGLTINTNTPAGASIAISGDGVTGVTIANNVLTTTASSNPTAAIHVTGVFGGTISGNTLSATGVGSNTAALSMNGLGTWTVAGNSLSATESGAPAGRTINLVGAANLTFTAGSTGNTLVRGSCNVTGGVSTGSIGLAGGATCP